MICVYIYIYIYIYIGTDIIYIKFIVSYPNKGFIYGEIYSFIYIYIYMNREKERELYL